MTCYVCKRCPLAFEVGYRVYWDLSGSYSQYLCCVCGTMHRIEHRIGKPDELFAQNGPIKAMIEVVRKDYCGREFSTHELPISEVSWRRIGELPTSQELQSEAIAPKRISGVAIDRLACSFCGSVGRLVSHEWPTTKDGACPVFGDRCPKCGDALEMVYISN